MKLPGCIAMCRDNKQLDFDEEQLNLVKNAIIWRAQSQTMREKLAIGTWLGSV